MGRSSDAPPRARSKAPDFSELFRSAHGSRHSSRTGAGTTSSPSSTVSAGDKPSGTKVLSRRSMLPFLGRRKPTEHSPLPPTPTPMLSKSVGPPTYPLTPVNTVRRSFGNGHAVFMITPSSDSPPVEPPLTPRLPSADVHTSSLGSKLVAHFAPSRSPSRTPKPRYLQTSVALAPPLPSTATLSPPFPSARAPSIESQRSSMRSRSTTPRPLRAPPSPAADSGDEEDFSDLFTLPDPLRKPPQYLKSFSSTSVHIYPGNSPKKSGELTPPTPITPSGPSLQFPIPPSIIGPPRPTLSEGVVFRPSSELASLSSQASRSPSKHSSPLVVDRGSAFYRDISSLSQRKTSRNRTISMSESDTDASRANGSTYSASSFKLAPVKPSIRKSGLPSPSATKTSSGPPPTLPLPSPPLSSNSGGSSPRSVANGSPNRVAFPRPRAATLSVTSNLAVPSRMLPKSNQSSPTRSSRANSSVAPDATVEELQEMLSQQCRKNDQLREYITTVTKRYEDDRMTMTRNIEKLERNIRKKTREIEGLRWLVIHNGAVSDIDAAANLARASFSTQEGDTFDAVRRSSQLSSGPMISLQHNASLSHQPMTGQQSAGITATATAPSDTSCSAVSFSMSSTSETTSLTTPPLSAIPERMDGITRTERQRLKEERRASKALRRISVASNFAFGPDPLTHSSSAEELADPNFDPKQSMDEVLEKLEPFRHT